VAVPPAPDSPSGVTPDDSPASPTTSRRLRLSLLVVLLVLLVGAVAAVAYLGATRPVPALGVEGSQGELQDERDQVMSTAEQFLLRVNTYGPDLLEDTQMPKYRQRVEEIITPKFDESFQQAVQVNEQLVAQYGYARTAEIYNSGVSAIDSDSATALVAGVLGGSAPKSQGSEERTDFPAQQFRIQVKLVKVQGEWLVDDYSPVTTGEDSDAGSGQGGLPSGIPSVEPPSPSGAPSSPSEGATP
jgi:Mce-associated membrane protein